MQAWAIERDFDAATVVSNLCEIEWPPRSGKTIEIPEVDRAGWFAERTALVKIAKGQSGFVRALARLLARP